MESYDQIKALFPDIINGKTHQQLMEEDLARDKAVGNHYIYGVNFTWHVLKSNLDALQSFEVRDDDVFIQAYPRSGSHWLVEIINLILNDGRGDFDRTVMTASLMFTLAADPSMLESATPGYKVCQEMKSPRCIPGHCLERFLPPQTFQKQAKFIYAARNPKDVINSLLNLHRSLENPLIPTNLDELLWCIANGRVALGSWFDHVLSYWKHRENPNFLFLKYEDLKKDLRGSVCKLAKHIEKDLSDDVIDTIVQRVSLDRMKETYQQLEEDDAEAVMATRFQNVKYIRKGMVGDWKNTFTVAQSALFDKMYAIKMKGTDLNFDFD